MYFLGAKPPYLRIGLLLLWCATLIAYWISRTFDYLATFLLWNLFLATLPLVWSAAFRSFAQCGRLIGAGIFFVVWLLFLPNAPYLATDLVHLGEKPLMPLWYVLATLLSFAGTGILLGYVSLREVHAVVEERFGKTVGWSVALVSLMLSGFGIYLGRFLRWNSWDAFTHPIPLLKSMMGPFLHPGSNPHPIPVTLIFGAGLTVGYLALRMPPLDPSRHSA